MTFKLGWPPSDPDKRTRITSAHGFFEVGQRVEAVYLTFGWHPATVVKVSISIAASCFSAMIVVSIFFLDPP